MFDAIVQLALLICLASLVVYVIALPLGGVSSPWWLPRDMLKGGRKGVRAVLQGIAKRFSNGGKWLRQLVRQYPWYIVVPVWIISGALTFLGWFIRLFVGKPGKKKRRR